MGWFSKKKKISYEEEMKKTDEYINEYIKPVVEKILEKEGYKLHLIVSSFPIRCYDKMLNEYDEDIKFYVKCLKNVEPVSLIINFKNFLEMKEKLKLRENKFRRICG